MRLDNNYTQNYLIVRAKRVHDIIFTEDKYLYKQNKMDITKIRLTEMIILLLLLWSSKGIHSTTKS